MASISDLHPARISATIARKVNWLVYRHAQLHNRYWLYERYQRLLGFPDAKRLFRKRLGYTPNLRKARTFAEKLMYLKLFRKDPQLVLLADKVRVREWVANRIGEEYLIPLIGVYDSPQAIDFDQLPNQFIIKMDFGSQRNVIVHDKSFIDRDEIKSRLAEWLKTPHDLEYMEWFHHAMQRKILIEKLLLAPDGQVPIDYKFYVFAGAVVVILVIAGRHTDKSHAFYTPTWEPTGASTTSSGRVDVFDKPNNLEQMCRIAERLGEGFAFIRVDLYSLNDALYFGEMTPFPVGGMPAIKPPTFDAQLASLLDIK